jgi:hypothetical protein
MRRLLFVSLAAGAVACSSPPPPPAPEPEMVSEAVTESRPTSADLALAAGDCNAIRAQAAANPDLAVDSLPQPLRKVPPELRNIPAGVIKPNVPAEVQVDIVIDTAGKANMATFKVVKTTHPWLATNIKGVIGKWTFSPALLRGCKVPRVYHFSATSAPAKRKPPAPARGD